MKYHLKALFYVTFLLVVAGIPGLNAQNGEKNEQPTQKIKPVSAAQGNIKVLGFIDKNKDGINDSFCDANGDGKNDVTGKAYPHRFEFTDENHDGSNDVWQDCDGDGVNDLAYKMSEKQKAIKKNIVLDYDKDGKNDITGVATDLENQDKLNVGFWDESSGKVKGRLIDEDGNGMDDRLERNKFSKRYGHRDFFVDEDGDGICDGRGDSLKRQRRRSRGVK